MASGSGAWPVHEAWSLPGCSGRPSPSQVPSHWFVVLRRLSWTSQQLPLTPSWSVGFTTGRSPVQGRLLTTKDQLHMVTDFLAREVGDVGEDAVRAVEGTLTHPHAALGPEGAPVPRAHESLNARFPPHVNGVTALALSVTEEGE